jgi:signal transduction histidine kinase
VAPAASFSGLQVERIREAERARIAREIHDDLGQQLTGLKMDLVRLSRTPRADLSCLTNVVDNMIASVQRIATDLHPFVLDDLGLGAAVEWYAGEFQKRTALRCLCRVTGDADRVDADRRTAVFRIFQEILTNIARHARASHVSIFLSVTRSAVRLDVRDNGRGFSPSGSRGFGLSCMQERAAAFGGTVMIVAHARVKGTRVRVHVPRGS